MKKVYSVLASLLAVGLVSAQAGGPTNADVVGREISTFFTGLFDSIQANPANLSTILFGALIWMVLYSVVKKMPLFEDMTFAAPIVSVILTVLSFIYIPRDIFNVAGANVGALGAIIITALPLMIAFYFTGWVANSQSTARVIWGGFFLYYFVILIYTWSSLPPTAGFFNGQDASEGFKNVFFAVGAFISLVMIAMIPYIRDKGWQFKLESMKEDFDRITDASNAYRAGTRRAIEG